MSAAVGQLEPLPGVGYQPTMSSSDIYPTHVGIGGIRTQDRALPAFGDATMAAHGEALATAALPAGLFSTPAGWLFLLAIGIGIISIKHGHLPRVSV